MSNIRETCGLWDYGQHYILNNDNILYSNLPSHYKKVEFKIAKCKTKNKLGILQTRNVKFKNGIIVMTPISYNMFTL